MHKHSPELKRVLRIFQIVSAFGLVLSAVTLAGETASNAAYRYALYTTWFAIAVVSIEAILNWVKVGIYALILSTLTITMVDLAAGRATMGGASLGLLVAFILFVYLRPLWGEFE